MKPLPWTTLTLLLVLSGGCSDPRSETKAEKVSSEEEAFFAKYGPPRTEDRIVKLEARVAQLERDLGAKVARQQPAEMSATSTGHFFINTRIGALMVVVVGVDPFLDGYRLKLRIGNPVACTLGGIRLAISYNFRKPKYEDFQSKDDPWGYFIAAVKVWEANATAREFPMVQELKAGAWTDYEVVLAPAKAENLAFLSVGVEFASATLNHGPE